MVVYYRGTSIGPPFTNQDRTLHQMPSTNWAVGHGTRRPWLTYQRYLRTLSEALPKTLRTSTGSLGSWVDLPTRRTTVHPTYRASAPVQGGWGFSLLFSCKRSRRPQIHGGLVGLQVARSILIELAGPPTKKYGLRGPMARLGPQVGWFIRTKDFLVCLPVPSTLKPL